MVQFVRVIQGRLTIQMFVGLANGMAVVGFDPHADEDREYFNISLDWYL